MSTRWRQLIGFLLLFLSASFLRAAEIGGVVKAKRSDRPIGGILIRVYPVENPEKAYQTYTARDGSYALQVPRGRYRVQAIPTGTDYLGAFYVKPDNPEQAGTVEVVAEDVFGFADILLETGGSIEGRITRLRDGVPLGNVRVSAESDSFRTVTLTDRSGRYVLHALPPDYYAVEAGVLDSNYIPTFYPGTPFSDSADHVKIEAGEKVSGINFKLEFGGIIRGSILSATTNQPLADVMAIAVPVSGNLPERFAYADSSGHYSINGLLRGKYRVEAGQQKGDSPEGEKPHQFVTEYFDRQFDQESATSVDVASAAVVTGIDFRLYRSNRIQGQVRSTFYNQGMPDVTVRPSLYLNGKLKIPSAVSGSDGKYQVENLPPGDYVVTAEPSEKDRQYVSTWYRDQIVRKKATELHLVDGDVYPNVDFNLRLGGNITGRASVDDSTYSMDFSHLHVVMSAPANEIEGFIPRVYDLDHDGNYSIFGAPIGQFHLAVTSEDPNIMLNSPSDSKTVVVTEGRELRDVNFLLHVGGSISGHVTIQKSHLTLDKYRILVLRLNEPFHEIVSISEGRYTVPGLLAGRYLVVLVEAVEPLTLEKLFSGPRWYDSRIVDVKKGVESTNLDFIISETEPPSIPPS